MLVDDAMMFKRLSFGWILPMDHVVSNFAYFTSLRSATSFASWVRVLST